VDIIDLNIGENYLNDWGVYYAIREIVANALDEQKYGDIKIEEKLELEYIIRDFGSGLGIEHFIMRGSDKIAKNDVIGKFGVGLKDALGVLSNNGIEVEIKTAKYMFKVQMKEKSEITKIKTLHVFVFENDEADFRGTEFTLRNCRREYIEQAKNEFLMYREPKLRILESTLYGDILEKENTIAEIFVNGMKISNDKNLAFSYNIKNISISLKKAINRDRKYVSRDAYREDIKTIIENCKDIYVLDAFEKQLKRTYKDESYSEIKWNTVLVNVTNYILKKYINSYVRFIGNIDIQSNKELYDLLCKSKDTEIICVSQKIRDDIEKYKKDIIKDDLFIEDLPILKDMFINFEDLSEDQRRVIQESVNIIKDIDFIKNDFVVASIANIKVSRIVVGSIMDEDDGIVIPLSSLTDVETCTVKIINVLASLGNNSTEFKDKIVGNLIKIIHNRNTQENN
jgi:hypothetical protein